MRLRISQALALCVGLLATVPAVESVVIGIDFGADWFKVRSIENVALGERMLVLRRCSLVASQVALVKPGNPPIQVVLNEASKRKSPTVAGFDGTERYGGRALRPDGNRPPHDAISQLPR
jgi:hypothetical protein